MRANKYVLGAFYSVAPIYVRVGSLARLAHLDCLIQKYSPISCETSAGTKKIFVTRVIFPTYFFKLIIHFYRLPTLYFSE